MKNPPLSVLLLLFWAALLLALPGRVIAYDSPDFDFEVFSRDGIFLPEEEKSSLLEALAAIASNFSTSTRVDDDLREKALGIALRIDPLHLPSRLAHRALSTGETPTTTPEFDTLNLISETLWTYAAKLSEAPVEPEQKRLAPFLMELSLLTQRDPPDGRLASFAASSEKKALPWDKFLTLSPESSQSSKQAHFLREEGLEILAKREKQAHRTALAEAAKISMPGAMSDETTDDTPARRGAIDPVAVFLNVVRLIDGAESKPALGVVTLTMRSPSGRPERDLVESPEDSVTGPVPLVLSRGSIALGSLVIPASLASAQAWKWPAGVLAEMGFSATDPPPGPPRQLRAGALLPSVVLIDSLLRHVSINERMILSGEIDPLSSRIDLPGGLVPTIEAAAAGKKGQYLLLPASAAEELIPLLVKTGQLELLFSNELLSYGTLAEAISLVSTPTPETLAAASVVFREIEAVSDRMPLADLARNAKVMERLEGILATAPQHLSARAMLEFGRLPESAERRQTRTAERINELVSPLLEVENPDADLNALTLKIDPAIVELSRLRTEVPAELRNFHSAGEDFLKACEVYLDLTNKGTSIALQRLREAKEARRAFQEQGVSLGLLYPEPEVE